MKPIKFLATCLIAAGVLAAASCKSGKDKNTGEQQKDTTTTSVTATNTGGDATAKTEGPLSMVMVRHKVADYAKWKTGYDSHDSARLAAGLHNYVITRGLTDTNMVMIGLKMDDMAKAKTFAASDDLKKKMKEVGVTGPPVIDFLEAEMNDASTIPQTIRLMVRHKVKDYDAWKKVFESDKQARMDAGLTDRVLAHTAGDNHMVTLVFAVADMDKAKAFVNSQGLKDKMKEGGVEGAPDIFFYTVAQRY